MRVLRMPLALQCLGGPAAFPPERAGLREVLLPRIHEARPGRVAPAPQRERWPHKTLRDEVRSLSSSGLSAKRTDCCMLLRALIELLHDVVA